MKSIWSETIQMPKYPSLSGNCFTKTVIIGGGITGILISYFLNEAGEENVILEANEIAGGQTKNTTAKVTSQHGLIYSKLLTQIGKEKTSQYAKANQNAVLEYEKLIRTKGISCDWERIPSYLYSCRDVVLLKKEEQAAKEAGLNVSFTTNTKLPFPVRSALKQENQAQFHPLKFLIGLLNEMTIYEHTKVEKIENAKNGLYLLYTSKGMVTAKRVIFASHYPFINVPGYYFLRMHQERSYCMAFRNAQMLDGMYYGIDPDGLSFRNTEEYLILGGSGHRTGENRKGKNYERLKKAVAEFYPKAKEQTAWSAQDCMPLDNIPYIGRFSKAKTNWYVATGFQKWGMTSSMVAAQLICDLIIGKKNEYETLFSPQRVPTLFSIPQILDEGKHTFKGLGRRLFLFPRQQAEQIPVGQGKVIEYRGEKLGVYKEKNGTIHAVSVKCPHLGCELNWNPEELSWDCPCHGSRFTFDGHLMDGPAQSNLKRKKSFKNSFLSE